MRTNFDEFEYDRMIQDPTNYKAGFLYFNRKDSRVMVPKRNKMRGLTLNFGNFNTYFLILGIILAMLIFTQLG